MCIDGAHFTTWDSSFALSKGCFETFCISHILENAFLVVRSKNRWPNYLYVLKKVMIKTHKEDLSSSYHIGVDFHKKSDLKRMSFAENHIIFPFFLLPAALFVWIAYSTVLIKTDVEMERNIWSGHLATATLEVNLEPAQRARKRNNLDEDQAVFR